MKKIYLVLIVLAVLITTAQAATFTYSDPACASFSILNGVISCSKTAVPAPVVVPPPVPAPVVPPATSDPGCPNGYTHTIVPITWAAHIDLKGPLQTMNHCQVKAYQFTMPVRGVAPSMTFYATVNKYLTLSQTAFDFSPTLEASACAAIGYNNAKIWNATTELTDSYVCKATAGATYYLNVRNATSRNGPDNCPAGTKCTFYLSW